MIIEPKRDILIGPLLRIGLTRCWAARDPFLRLAIMPVVVLLLIDAPFRDTLEATRLSAATGQGDPQILLRALALALCYGAVVAVFSVNWIRTITLGVRSAPGLGLTIGARHIRFFFLIFGITVMILVPAMIVTTVMAVLMGSAMAGALSALVLGMLLWAALLARLSPAWIGMAIDARMPLSTAWRRTAGQGFKLLLAMITVEVVTTLVQQVIFGLLVITGLADAAPYATSLVLAVLGLAGIATQLAVLVSAFPHFLRETV